MSTPTTFWRLAGMSYLQYVNKASAVVVNALKEPAKSQALARMEYSFNKSVWEAGTQGKKVPMKGA
eukprot:CAMPEP_0116057328 /NCGR_PEP_ID=MMETSP0322-20121206/4541_1 /TAXON_ID=163516 /ORGANISM="Leptocylindrus danicus var. apora, Strain B651" /LENGTH=65 /DNA_ID=CAMNT_0003541309 /DNA_START=95 /DNA_END=292 /DNA_ORIENTATION=-